MPDPSHAVWSYLDRASPRFREVFESLARAVKEVFPDAEASFQFRMPGWKIPRRRDVDPKSVKGTLDPNWVQIYLVERRSGITLHLWNPVGVQGFQRHKAELERAGFKLMVGSLRFNRKSGYPIALVVGLLKDIEASLVEDARIPAEEARRGEPAAAKSKVPMDDALRRQLDEWSTEPPMDGGD